MFETFLCLKHPLFVLRHTQQHMQFGLLHNVFHNDVFVHYVQFRDPTLSCRVATHYAPPSRCSTRIGPAPVRYSKIQLFLISASIGTIEGISLLAIVPVPGAVLRFWSGTYRHY